jgi:hypothetical protein
VRIFFYIVLPHLKRAITVVIMIETIFLLSVFAEIFTTTAGGPGTATTNLTFLIYPSACSSSISAWPRPAASSPWCWPISCRSSWCACWPGTSRENEK